jgi:CHASE2 domain-containing sensor protein
MRMTFKINGNKTRNYLLLIAIVSACGTRQQEIKVETDIKAKVETDTKVNELVLVNAGVIDRCQMSQLVRSISECNPKIIGVNFLFTEEKDEKCDSSLRQAIVDSDRVILAEGYENDTHIMPHKKFFDAAYLSGLTGFIQSEDGVIDYYYRLSDNKGRWAYSFPFLIALQDSTDRGSELAAKSSSKDYPIILSHDLNDFKVVDKEDIQNHCGTIEGKLVIIGYLGPDHIDIFKTRSTTNSIDITYGTIVTANIVLDILKDLE